MFVVYAESAPKFRDELRNELNRRLSGLRKDFERAKTQRRKVEVRAAYNEVNSLLYFLNSINFVDERMNVVDREVETAYNPLPLV